MDILVRRVISQLRAGGYTCNMSLTSKAWRKIDFQNYDGRNEKILLYFLVQPMYRLRRCASWSRGAATSLLTFWDDFIYNLFLGCYILAHSRLDVYSDSRLAKRIWLPIVPARNSLVYLAFATCHIRVFFLNIERIWLVGMRYKCEACAMGKPGSWTVLQSSIRLVWVSLERASKPGDLARSRIRHIHLV